MKWKFILLLILLASFTQAEIVASESNLVIIKDFKFSAQEITIQQGEIVRWENREKRQYHNVWFADSGEEEPDYLFPEDSYEREFLEVGSFLYRCGPHPKMTGIVHVIPSK